MIYYLDTQSQEKLSGVHPDLVKVVERAIQITKQDFCVICGVRTEDQEARAVQTGHSETMHSRHLHGFAVDLAAWVNGDINWQQEYYQPIADAVLQAAAQLQIPIIWGGSWQTLKDWGHFELNRTYYPDPQPIATT